MFPCTINCPRLKVFDFGTSEESPPYLPVMIDVSSLQEVKVVCLPNHSSSDLIYPFFRHFENVDVVTLACDAFKQLSWLEEMDFPRNGWKCLVLPPWFAHKKWLLIIHELVRSSVKLEELIIHIEQSQEDCTLLGSELSTSCELALLKTVTIYGHAKCCDGQLQVIDFLLRNAAVLEKMVINTRENQLPVDEELHFVMQVSRFRRASSNATVVFNENVLSIALGLMLLVNISNA